MAIQPLDEGAMEQAAARQARWTKPAGSLGRLEARAVRIAGMTGRTDPTLGDAVVFTLVADHGVAAEGVSAYPREVTAQMVLNFLRGGAAINVLAREVHARVVVADIGVDAELPPHPHLRAVKVRRGTGNITRGPAMSIGEANRAIEVGRRLVRDERLDIALTGDMGIGNTTAPAATGYMVASHRSHERGHGAVLERLRLRPLLDLDLRLGEGTGAALALPLVRAAVRLLNEMATFDEAGVSERS